MNMNKEKLISQIIKKQTYKDTKDTQQEIARLSNEAVNISIEAIKQILTTEYNAQAKLYAVRYLKDCFEKGTPLFLERTEHQMLPILVFIIRDSTDQKSIMKYAGSYVKKEQLEQFKSIILSFFLLAKQCVRNWAQWIPDRKRTFLDTFEKLKKEGISFEEPNKYFRDENSTLFFQGCKRNGLPYYEQNIGIQYSNQQLTSLKQTENQGKKDKKKQNNPPGSIKQVVFKSNMNQFKNRDPKVDRVLTQSKVMFDKQKITQKDINSVQDKFNTALDHYLETNPNIDQEYMQECMRQFQTIKNILGQKVKGQSIVVVAAKSDKSRVPSSNLVESKTRTNQQQISRQDIGFSSVSGKSSAAFGQNIQKFQKDSSISTIKKEIQEASDGSPLKMLAQKLKSNSKQSRNLYSNETDSRGYRQSKESQIRSREQQQRESNSNLVKQISFSKETPGNQQIKERIKDKTMEGSKKGNQRVNFQENSQWSQSQKGNSMAEIDECANRMNPAQFPHAKTKLQEDRFRNANMKKNKPTMQMPTPIQEQSEESRRSQTKRTAVSNRINSKKVQTIIQDSGKNNQEFKYIRQQLTQLKIDYQMMEENNIMLQRQIYKLKEQEKVLLQRLRHTVPLEDVTKLKKELYEQRRQKSLMQQKTNEFQQQIGRLNKLIKELEYNPLKSGPKIQSQQKFELVIPKALQTKNHTFQNLTSVSHQSRILDPNKPTNDKQTANLANIASQLSQQNINLFKKSILGLSKTFFQDKTVGISSQTKLIGQNQQPDLNLTLKFSSRYLLSEPPQIKYQNIQQIDLWKKPLRSIQEGYQQQLVAKKRTNPLKLLKGHIEMKDYGSATFLMPFIYFSFTKSQAFQKYQFNNIFSVKHQQIFKSKIFQLDTSIIKQIDDFKKIFSYVLLDGNFVDICLSQYGKQNVFMCQFEILKNQKAVLRVLPIPNHADMNEKAKQLSENLLFLFGK